MPQAHASTAARATGFFLFAVAFTAGWLGLNVVLQGLQATGIPSVLIRLVIHTTMLVGLWRGLARTGFDTGTRVKVWLAIALPFSAWLGIVWWLAVDGAFRPRPGVPALPIAIFLPLLVGLPILLRSERIGALLDAAPASWLVGLQVYRVFGGIFLVAWSRGNISGTFALPAGVGDVLVGLLALPVAYLLHAGAPGARSTAIAWNILGLVDFCDCHRHRHPERARTAASHHSGRPECAARHLSHSDDLCLRCSELDPPACALVAAAEADWSNRRGDARWLMDAP